MVKLHRVLQDGGGTSGKRGNYLTVSGLSSFKGYRRKRLVRVKVLKMLTPRRSGSVGAEDIANGHEEKEPATTNVGAVTPGSYENPGDGSKEFLSTGRTGRRNALPDIMGKHAETGISDLPERFGELNTGADQAGTSGTDLSQPGTSKQHG